MTGQTASDGEAFARFFHRMLDKGIYLPASKYEAWFLPPPIPTRTSTGPLMRWSSVFREMKREGEAGR